MLASRLVSNVLADLKQLHGNLANVSDLYAALTLLKRKYEGTNPRFLASFGPEYLDDLSVIGWSRALRPPGMPSDNNGLEGHNSSIKDVSFTATLT